jgi:protocatechuate 3,4-dioxygenase beta subunit
MDPSDPLRGRAGWALVAALLVPLVLSALLIPAPLERGGTAQVGAPATPAPTDQPAEPPAPLLPPPAPARGADADRAPAEIAHRHRPKSVAFDAFCGHADARLARLELTLREAVTGRPLPGAAVEIVRAGERELRHADARGVLALDLPPGPLELVAWSGSACGGPFANELQAGVLERHALDLHPAAAVVGRVTDARTGEPVAGATVAFWTHAELDRVAAGADGRFHHPRFPAHAPEQQVRIGAPGYATAVRYLELGPGVGWTHRAAHAGERDVVGHALPARVEVALQPQLALSGRVLDARGRPIAGARVAAVGYARVLPDVATRDAADAVSDDAGRFLLEGLRPDVSHALHVRSAGHAELVRELPAPAGEPWTGEPHDLGDLALGRPALLAGALVDAAGIPIADARVQLRRVDLPPPSPASAADPGARPALADRALRTDASGAFLFDGLAAGAYEVRARRDRGVLASLAIELDAAEERADVRLVPDRDTWTLRGVVRGAAGPVAGAEVVVERFGAVARLRADAAGRFALAGLDDAATYTVRAAGEEARAWAWEVVELRAAGAQVARR